MITRQSSVPGVGSAPEVLGTAFALKAVNSISKPVEYDRGSIVMTLLEKTSLNLEDYNQIKDSLEIAVLQKKHQDVYNRWFNQMIENADIVNNVKKFYRSY